ncbi:MAG: ferrous iron transport protein B [Flavobacteriales bacterium]|nr:ferrous iron transport protein B [Flavobacteriales bacterium]
MNIKKVKIALAGNPNTGKTSLFNALTGMNQRVGNYPGITVDKKIGFFQLNDETKVELIDLPGTYSLNPGSLDEEVVLKVLTDDSKDDYPEILIFVADATNLKRNLYFYSQLSDLGIPTILALNMVDLVEKKGIHIDVDLLSKELDTPVVFLNARKGVGIDELKAAITNLKPKKKSCSIDLHKIAPKFLPNIKKAINEDRDYIAWVKAVQKNIPQFIDPKEKENILNTISSLNINVERLKIKETIARYQYVNHILKKVIDHDANEDQTITGKIDKIATHKVMGYVIFFFIMIFLFQAIYSWASIPMDFIDSSFSSFAVYLSNALPEGPLNSLISEGIIPGIGGIVIFIPQIAILFAFISIMEDTGYMSRVVFIMDKLMRKFGMSGKSIVPLMSGMACAVPAIMSTRTISDWKERIITILVTPFITCAARLPVYSIIIAIIIPNETVFGFFNIQGLVLMGMYLLGFLSALLSAAIANKFLKIKASGSFIIEMPSYKIPYYKNIGLDIIEKTKAFIFDAGKIILTLSIVLWVLASYGPNDNVKNASNIVKLEKPELSGVKLNNEIASYKLENSYIGHFGHFIEPAIRPLGYDWKIGIALISSLAAREVFVSTMATIYSVGSSNDSDGLTIIKRMQGEINPNTGKKVYTFAVGWSLLIFYAFAMQCMSTIAIVKRETNSWKWTIVQTVFMTGVAYISSFIVYQILK